MLHLNRLLPLFLFTLLLAGCGGVSDPEQQIRDWVKRGEEAVEARELLRVADLLDEGYKDARGMDKKGAMRIVAGFILRNKSIFLYTHAQQIEIPEPDRARLVLFVAMAGQPFTGAETLVSLRADLHRFEIQLRREDGDWLATSADWRQVTQTDILDY